MTLHELDVHPMTTGQHFHEYYPNCGHDLEKGEDMESPPKCIVQNQRRACSSLGILSNHLVIRS